MTWAWKGDGALVRMPSLVIPFPRPVAQDSDPYFDRGPTLNLPDPERPHQLLDLKANRHVIAQPIRQRTGTLPHVVPLKYLRRFLLVAGILSSQPTLMLAQPFSHVASGPWPQQTPAPAHPQTPPRPLITAH